MAAVRLTAAARSLYRVQSGRSISVAAAMSNDSKAQGEAWDKMLKDSGLERAILKAAEEVDNDPVIQEIEQYLHADARSEQFGPHLKKAIEQAGIKDTETEHHASEVKKPEGSFEKDFAAEVEQVREQMKEVLKQRRTKFIENEPKRRENAFFNEEEERKWNDVAFFQ